MTERSQEDYIKRSMRQENAKKENEIAKQKARDEFAKQRGAWDKRGQGTRAEQTEPPEKWEIGKLATENTMVLDRRSGRVMTYSQFAEMNTQEAERQSDGQDATVYSIGAAATNDASDALAAVAAL